MASTSGLSTLNGRVRRQRGLAVDNPDVDAIWNTQSDWVTVDNPDVDAIWSTQSDWVTRSLFRKIRNEQ